MINSISRINNFNLQRRNLNNNNAQPKGQICFQGNKTALTTIPLTMSALSSIAFINKNFFEEYYEKISKIKTYIWINEQPIRNPEFDTYIEKLDNLTDKEKKQFVKTFCEKTGYPNLEQVQKNMDNEIKRAIDVCFKDSDAKPLFAGYSSVCSVGKAVALPGSDCDGLFIVSDKPSGENVPYRHDIGDEINQRILETQGTHYPELFSIEERTGIILAPVSVVNP